MPDGEDEAEPDLVELFRQKREEKRRGLRADKDAIERARRERERELNAYRTAPVDPAVHAPNPAPAEPPGPPRRAVPADAPPAVPGPPARSQASDPTAGAGASAGAAAADQAGPPAAPGPGAGPSSKAGPGPGRPEAGDAPAAQQEAPAARSRARRKGPSAPSALPAAADGPDPPGRAGPPEAIDVEPILPAGRAMAGQDDGNDTGPENGTPAGGGALVPANPPTGAMVQALRDSGIQPSLSILNPALGLASRLGQDANVTVRGSPAVRRAGIAMLVAGLVLLLAGLRLEQAASRPYVLAVAGVEVPLAAFTGALALVGLVVAVVGAVSPSRRRLGVRFRATQKEEWQRVQREARRLRFLPYVAYGALAVGFLAAYRAFTLPQLHAPAAALGLLLVGLAIGLLAYTAARRTALHRLYLQTLVLANLEREGALGAMGDSRVAPVLLALDRLLGSLPEDKVREFLKSQEAEDYLDLMQRLQREAGGQDGR